MEPLVITDDYLEQVRIGKRIFETHPEQYSPRRMALIHETLNVYAADWPAREKQDALYHSFYDYWVYGNDLAEEFIFDFAHKTHAEKCRYMTLRGKHLYIDYLNDKTDAKIFSDKYRAYLTFRKEYAREVSGWQGPTIMKPSVPSPKSTRRFS